MVVLDILQGVEAEVDQLDGLVHIALLNEVSEVELGHSLRDTDDGQESSWSDVGVAQIIVAVSLELSLLNVSGDDVVVKLCWNRGTESLSVGNERPHDLTVDSGVSLGSTFHLMDLSDVLSEHEISLRLSSVE